MRSFITVYTCTVSKGIKSTHVLLERNLAIPNTTLQINKHGPVQRITYCTQSVFGSGLPVVPRSSLLLPRLHLLNGHVAILCSMWLSRKSIFTLQCMAMSP